MLGDYGQEGFFEQTDKPVEGVAGVNWSQTAVDFACEIVRPSVWAALAAKQAKIDALMLEFCPGEMSAEQRAEWAKHQVLGDPSVHETSKQPANFAWVPWHPKKGYELESITDHEEDRYTLANDWQWVPVYAGSPPETKADVLHRPKSYDGCMCHEVTNGYGGVNQVWCGKHWAELITCTHGLPRSLDGRQHFIDGNGPESCLPENGKGDV